MRNAKNVNVKKLALNRTTVRTLNGKQLEGALGGLAPIPSYQCSRAATHCGECK